MLNLGPSFQTQEVDELMKWFLEHEDRVMRNNNKIDDSMSIPPEHNLIIYHIQLLQRSSVVEIVGWVSCKKLEVMTYNFEPSEPEIESPEGFDMWSCIIV